MAERSTAVQPGGSRGRVKDQIQGGGQVECRMRRSRGAGTPAALQPALARPSAGPPCSQEGNSHSCLGWAPFSGQEGERPGSMEAAVECGAAGSHSQPRAVGRTQEGSGHGAQHCDAGLARPEFPQDALFPHSSSRSHRAPGWQAGWAAVPGTALCPSQAPTPTGATAPPDPPPWSRREPGPGPAGWATSTPTSRPRQGHRFLRLCPLSATEATLVGSAASPCQAASPTPASQTPPGPDLVSSQLCDAGKASHLSGLQPPCHRGS